MATKKSGGSSRNGRDSAGRRLGIKNNHFILEGSIILRQRGTEWHPGKFVGMGRDHTLYATCTGHVYFTFDRIQSRSIAHVKPIIQGE